MTIGNFKLSRKDFTAFGQGLSRPECVWIEQSGEVWVSDTRDERGAVALVRPGQDPTVLGRIPHELNGYSRDKAGNFIVAGFGDGKVYCISPQGQTTVLLDNIDGKPLGAVNHCWVDSKNRKWISVSTIHRPWFPAANDGQATGYVILMDDRGARIVADGIHFTNEVKLDPSERFLYAAESLESRMIRFPVSPNGDLGKREIVGPSSLGHGAITDGFAFDEMGNVWVTTILRNGIVVIEPNGTAHTVYEEPKLEALDRTVENMSKGVSQPTDMGTCTGDLLGLPTSLAFGGADRKTVYLGSLALSHLMTFRSPVAGAVWK